MSNFIMSSTATASETEPKQPMICMSIPLITRVFELVREDVKSDADLHFILEEIIEMSIEEGNLTMEDYEDIAKANPTT